MERRLSRRLGLTFLLALVVASPALLVAQAKSPADKPPPIVTVTKADGSTVRGHFLSADPDVVTLRPPGKAGEEPEPFTVPWTEIRKLSNGLTRAEALERWKAEHRENLCETCAGNRTVECGTCKGVGHDPAASKDCTRCKGALVVECKAPKCDAGKTRCPNPCVKLTEGRWVTKEDGKKWRLTPTPGGGVMSISEGHVGEVMYFKDGTIVNEGKCTRCAGTTTVDCAECGGDEQSPCPTCKNKKAAADCPDAGCESGAVKCATCDGGGLKKA